MTNLKSLVALAATLLLCLPAAAEEHGPGVHIHDAFALANMKNGAVFFRVHNNTDADVTITAASSDLAALTEMHSHKDAGNGVMQMIKIEGGVPVPTGEVHEFARGADHVMLMGLKSDLKEGDIVTITLTFDGADPVTFDAPVSGDAMKGGHDHSKMGHGTAEGG